MKTLIIAMILQLTFLTNLYATKILILGPKGENFNLAIQGLTHELNEFEFQQIYTQANTPISILKTTILNSQPDGLVLLDNSILGKIETLSKSQPVIKALPKFALMSLNLKSSIKNLPNSYGVELEVPAYTLFTQFRRISDNSFSKVGVFYQKSLQEYINISKKQLAKELIELVAICVDCDDKSTERDIINKMNKGARSFIFKERINVIWMLADNATLNKKTLKDFWLKTIKPSKFSVVTPFAEYTKPQVNLGHFAAQVDFHALGSQTGMMIESYFDGQMPRIRTEPPLVVKTYLNLFKAKQTSLKINSQQLQNIDHILE